MNCIYIGRSSELDDLELYGKAYRLISNERRAKVDRLMQENDKKLSITAELLLINALKIFGIKDGLSHITYGKHQKPYLDTNGVYFNLSHSGDYAACVICRSETGCDIEKIEDADIKTAERFFCRQELDDIISKSTQSEKNDTFFRYWTLKESFVKATGFGMSLPFNKFQITLNPNPSVIWKENGGRYSFYELDCIDGYKCSVCIKDSKCALAVETVKLKTILQEM